MRDAMSTRNKAEVDLWVKQAEMDCAAAEHLADHGNYDWACFACQQAAEKALKALLLAHQPQGQEAKRGPRHKASALFGAAQSHSVVQLWQTARKLADDLRGMRKHARQLDRHYLLARYPDTRNHPLAPCQRYTQMDYERCRDSLRALMEAVRRAIAAARPSA